MLMTTWVSLTAPVGWSLVMRWQITVLKFDWEVSHWHPDKHTHTHSVPLVAVLGPIPTVKQQCSKLFIDETAEFPLTDHSPPAFWRIVPLRFLGAADWHFSRMDLLPQAFGIHVANVLLYLQVALSLSSSICLLSATLFTHSHSFCSCAIESCSFRSPRRLLW